jgi:hypothetical protein
VPFFLIFSDERTTESIFSTGTGIPVRRQEEKQGMGKKLMDWTLTVSQGRCSLLVGGRLCSQSESLIDVASIIKYMDPIKSSPPTIDRTRTCLRHVKQDCLTDSLTHSDQGHVRIHFILHLMYLGFTSFHPGFLSRICRHKTIKLAR